MPIELKEWVDRVFGGAFPMTPEEVSGLDEICGPDQATLVRLTEVFENAPALLQPYSDEDLNQAIWDLGSEVLACGGRRKHRLACASSTSPVL